MPLVVLLTDGEQTVLGGDEAAIAAAEEVKAAGIDVVALSLGEANQYTLDRIASSPTETYSHTHTFTRTYSITSMSSRLTASLHNVVSIPKNA